jgi:hypothetical protein
MNRKLRRITASFLRARLLVIALAAGALFVSTTAAYAEPKSPVDPDVRCAAKIGPGEYDFYLPGAKVTDKDGNKWVCGPDGMWFKDYSALVVRFNVAQVLAPNALLRG